MKLFFLALCLLSGNLYAQDTITICGNIQNRLSDSVSVVYNDNKIAYYPSEYFARLDKNGNFSLSFPVPHGVYTIADIRHGNKGAEAILHAGDSIYLKTDAAHFDSSLRYQGYGSARYNFIAKHKIERGRMNAYTVQVRTSINREPADFLKEIQQELNGELNFLNRNKNGLPEDFMSFWKAYYQYYNYFFIQQYPATHEMVKRRRYTDTVPEANYVVVKEMPYAFNDSFLQVPSYLLYLTGVFDIKLKAAGYTFAPSDLKGQQKIEDSTVSLCYKLMPSKSAEYFIAQNIYGRTRHRELSRTEKQYKTFKKHWPKSGYIPALDKQIALAHRLDKSMPAPNINITTEDGKTRKLSDLRGKVVYLAFWASWCKPCVGEMISANRLKDTLKNKQPEFVYVAIDNDTATEHKILKRYNIHGLFTHAEGWSSKECELYGVQGLPAYYLIDKNGKFAMQDAPMPSQIAVLVPEIDKLLKQ